MVPPGRMITMAWNGGEVSCPGTQQHSDYDGQSRGPNWQPTSYRNPPQPLLHHECWTSFQLLQAVRFSINIHRTGAGPTDRKISNILCHYSLSRLPWIWVYFSGWAGVLNNIKLFILSQTFQSSTCTILFEVLYCCSLALPLTLVKTSALCYTLCFF